jgi:general secretion pathway protein N
MQRKSSTSRNPAVAAPWGWAVAGAVLGVLIAIVLFAPARWLGNVISQASAGQVQLIEPQGTLWNGSARLLLTGGTGSRDSAALPGQVDWRLRPGWLALNFQMTAACCTPVPLQARLSPGWSASVLQLADGTSQWPAALLAGLGTPWNTVKAEGSLRLMTQGLSMTWNEGRMVMAGRAELTALSMSSRLSTLKPMGSYRITLHGGDSTALEVTTLEGSLQLSGSGQWVGARLRFQGMASAAPEHEAALANLLNIIGRREGTRSIITLG